MYSNFWTVICEKKLISQSSDSVLSTVELVPPFYDLQLDLQLMHFSLSLSLSQTHSQPVKHILTCPLRTYFLSFILNNLSGTEGSYSFPWAYIKGLGEACHELLSFISIIIIKCPSYIIYSFNKYFQVLLILSGTYSDRDKDVSNPSFIFLISQ